VLYGICGTKGHGKDTFASLVVEAGKGFTVAAFANSLKRICQRVFGLSEAQCYDPDQKETPLPQPLVLDNFLAGLSRETGLDLPAVGLVAYTPREVLQYVGTEYIRSTQEDYWLHRAFADIGSASKVLITDLRFLNEADALRSRGGKVVRILRIDKPGAVDDHASEACLEQIKPDLIIGARTGDLSLPKRIAWLVACNRFNDAMHYDWRRVQEALAAYQAGASLEASAQLLGFTGKDPYGFHNIGDYYGVPRRASGGKNRKPHEIREGVPHKHCGRCSIWKPVEAFNRSSKAWDGLMPQCRACQSERNRERYAKQVPDSIRGLHKRVVLSAAQRALEVEISVDDLQHLWDEQRGMCAYSGVPMSLQKGELTRVTVDRIDSQQGYLRGNVTLCSYSVNLMKRDFTVSEFKEHIENLFKHRDHWPG